MLLTKYAKKLLCIGCFCIGTDQTDLDCAAALGIPVFNSAFANTRSVAELVISCIIALSRKVGDQNKWIQYVSDLMNTIMFPMLSCTKAVTN